MFVCYRWDVRYGVLIVDISMIVMRSYNVECNDLTM